MVDIGPVPDIGGPSAAEVGTGTAEALGAVPWGTVAAIGIIGLGVWWAGKNALKNTT